jgi:hypothetical protein
MRVSRSYWLLWIEYMLPALASAPGRLLVRVQTASACAIGDDRRRGKEASSVRIEIQVHEQKGRLNRRRPAVARVLRAAAAARLLCAALRSLTPLLCCFNRTL